MRRIVLTEGSPTPKVVTRYGSRIFDNARGGSYKYGDPIEFNREAINRLHSRGKDSL